MDYLNNNLVIQPSNFVNCWDPNQFWSLSQKPSEGSQWSFGNKRRRGSKKRRIGSKNRKSRNKKSKRQKSRRQKKKVYKKK